MYSYRMLLQVKATAPVTQDQLDRLNGDRYVDEISGDVGGTDAWVTITWRTADMTGAFTWATNRVLDRIPGRLVRAVLDEVSE